MQIFFSQLCLLTMTIIMATGQTVTAQESTSTATTTEEVVVPTVPTNQPPASEEQQTALSAAAQTRLTNLAANVSNRMDAYVRRITNVTDRLESRATKLEMTGLEVTAARTKIAEARVELEKARNTLTTIDAAVTGFVRSENPRTYWQQVKTTYTNARDAIKAAHRATIDTLLLLQSATVPTPPPTATSTETSTDIVE